MTPRECCPCDMQIGNLFAVHLKKKKLKQKYNKQLTVLKPSEVLLLISVYPTLARVAPTYSHEIVLLTGHREIYLGQELYIYLRDETRNLFRTVFENYFSLAKV
jgi:hypothetical protein